MPLDRKPSGKMRRRFRAIRRNIVDSIARSTVEMVVVSLSKFIPRCAIGEADSCDKRIIGKILDCSINRSNPEAWQFFLSLDQNLVGRERPSGAAQRMQDRLTLPRVTLNA